MNIIMRALTMLWCDLLVAAAVIATSRVARSIWPTLGVMITAMPVLLCASVAAAPNGVQMASGLLMWAAICGLVFGERTTQHRTRWLLGLWSVGSCGVLLTHSTGPLWFGISFLVGVALLGKQQIVELFRDERNALVSALALVVGAGLFSVLWTLTAGVNLPPSVPGNQASPPLIDYLSQPMLWLLQCIGVVPFRNQFAPPIAYAFGLAVIGAFLLVALRRRYRAGRIALIVIALIALAISVGLDRFTYASQGHAWQGRYTLALTYGIPVIAGWIVGTYSAARHARGSVDVVLATSIGAAVAVTNVVTVINIWNLWCRPHWLHDQGSAPSTALVVMLALVGALAMVTAFGSMTTGSSAVPKPKALP